MTELVTKMRRSVVEMTIWAGGAELTRSRTIGQVCSDTGL